MRLHCLRERQHDQEQDQRDRCTEQYVSPEVKAGLTILLAVRFTFTHRGP